MPKKIRRRPYVPVHRMQLRYTALFLFFMVLAALIGGYTVFYTGWSILGEKLANVYPQGQIMVIFRNVNIALVRNILIAVPFIIFFSFMATHRIAGPIVRIRRVLEQVAGGEYVRVTLRKGDELQDIAEAINKLTDKLKEQRP